MTTTTTSALLPQHERLITGSAISAEVAAARGYRSAETKSELEALGFGPAQRRVPALLIPIFGVRGEIATYQLRPDAPRIKTGKPLKYETPAGTHMALDVPPLARPSLGDPKRPLFVTEGARKADAAVSRGLCSIALLGVWNWRGRNQDGGKVALPDWESIALNERPVYVIFDSDVMEKAAVHAALARLREFLASRGAQVRLVYLAAGEGGAKVGLDDFFAAGKSVDDLLALATTELRGEKRPKDGLRPRIVVSSDVATMADQVEAVLLKAEGLFLYQQTGRLVEPARDGQRASAGAPPEGAIHVREVGLYRLVDLSSQHTEWAKLGEDGAVAQIARPDQDALRSLLSRPLWRFPYLRGVVMAPCLRPDGTILDRVGYDPSTGLLFADSRTHYPPVPEKPDVNDARDALEALREVFTDFPFLKPCDHAAALAALLGLVARHAIAGPVPLVVVRSPTPGTGKSLLVDAISVIATGRPATRFVQPGDPEEERKLLFALALDGEQLVLIDNVARPLGSPALDATLTSQEVGGRIMTTNRTAKVPFTACMFATGNNIQVKGDLARRVIVVDLDPGVERPEEERAGFHHPELLDFVRAERGRLVSAALTVLRAFVVAGRPRNEETRPIGGFEAWDRLVRRALLWIGEADPAEGRARVREEASPELEGLRELLIAWREAIGCDVPVTLQRVVEIANSGTSLFGGRIGQALTGTNARLRQALAALDPHMDADRLDGRRLGYAFRKHQGRIVEGLRLVNVGRREDGMAWALQQMHILKMAVDRFSASTAAEPSGGSGNASAAVDHVDDDHPFTCARTHAHAHTRGADGNHLHDLQPPPEPPGAGGLGAPVDRAVDPADGWQTLLGEGGAS